MNKLLSPAERRALKARAHPLKPVVMVGSDGLTPSVMREIDFTLKSHELIKIRVASDDRIARESVMGDICMATGASAVQHIGKILVVYREKPEEEAPAVEPKPAPRKAAKKVAKKAAPRKPAKAGAVWTKVRSPRPR